MLIDVSLPIKAGAVFRQGSPPVKISCQKYFHESEGEYESTSILLPAHTATHIDLVFRDKRIDLNRMVGRGKLIDATHISGREVRYADIANRNDITRGNFVFFRTGWTQFAGTEQYYDHPELSSEVVHWLISREINMVGVDALGLGKGRKHGEYDRLLANHNIFVIENLTNLSEIPKQDFTVYCFPLRIDDIDAIPARVVIETDEIG
jgi:kynurenine formamidase